MTRLIADIGATNARFALAERDGIKKIEVLSCAEHPSLRAAVSAYLKKTRQETPKEGIFAVAAPVGGDTISMPNHPWTFSIQETQSLLGLQSFRVINDFTALAYAVPHLKKDDISQIGEGKPRPGLPVAIIGPGTGLGVGAIVFSDGKPIPVATEGGHVTMPATTPREFALFEWLKQEKYSHISAERVISGKGLVNLYNAIRGIDALSLPDRDPAEITATALKKSCDVSAEALDLFCHFLGVAAGNLALTYGAFGGVYIAGGIVPRMLDYFSASRFRASFLSKGRFRDYLAQIPTSVITHPYPGLEGLRHATF